MKYGKELAFVMLGAGMTLAYQKYSKPMMNKAEEVINKSMKKVDKKLENMM